MKGLDCGCKGEHGVLGPKSSSDKLDCEIRRILTENHKHGCECWKWVNWEEIVDKVRELVNGELRKVR